MGRFTEDKLRVWILATLLAALLCSGVLAFGDPVPTPTPGTPEEWSDWLDERPDVTLKVSALYDPVETAGGSHSRWWKMIKQSLGAGIAVELEIGYIESRNAADKLTGHWSQGYVSTVLTDPVLGDSRRPEDPGTPVDPRPRPTPITPAARRPPAIGSVIPGVGRVKDVIISTDPRQGAGRKNAAVVPSARLIDPVVGKVTVERRAWHSSYQIFRGPVWIEVKTE